MDRNIQLVMNQTVYSRQEAIDQLLLHNQDVEKTIRSYLHATTNADTNTPHSLLLPPRRSLSVNQTIFAEIRKWMATTQKKE